MAKERADERNRAYGEYFNRLLEKLKTEIPNYTVLPKAPQKNPLAIRTSMSGLTYNHRFNNEGGYQVELNIETPNGEQNKAFFDFLYSQRRKIEGITGALVWNRLDGHRPCRISFSIGYTTVADVMEDSVKLEKTLSWSVEYGKKFKDAFGPLIKTLRAGTATLSADVQHKESAPTTQRIVERTTLVLVVCPFCGTKNEQGTVKCTNCHGAL